MAGPRRRLLPGRSRGASRVAATTLSRRQPAEGRARQVARHRAPRSCSWTSRRAAWTSERAPRSTGICAASPTTAWRSSSPRRTSPRCSASPTRVVTFYRGREVARYAADAIDERSTRARDITHPERRRPMSPDPIVGRDDAAIASAEARPAGPGGGIRSCPRRRGRDSSLLFVFGVTSTQRVPRRREPAQHRPLAAIIGTVALGMTFVTITGNFFSLSVAQTAAFAAVMFAGLAGGRVAAAARSSRCWRSASARARPGRAGRARRQPDHHDARRGCRALRPDGGRHRQQDDPDRQRRRGVARARPAVRGARTRRGLFLLLTIVGSIILSRTRLGRRSTSSARTARRRGRRASRSSARRSSRSSRGRDRGDGRGS